jgi:hypothetical protein
MVNNIPGCNILLRKIYRLLFLVFLAVFTISPIVDAYSDSLSSSLVFFNDLNDSDSPVSIYDLKLNHARKSLHALRQASNHYHNALTLSLRASLKDEPVCHIIKIQISANDIKSSQTCPPLSSDPSPPVI